MISGINHITLAVSDLQASLAFYRDLLGCQCVHVWDKGAYLEAGDAWVCLSVGSPVDVRTDYTHLAFDVTKESFMSFTAAFDKMGVELWQKNTSEGDSIYFLDPDGHKLELHVGSLKTRMSHIKSQLQDQD